MSTMHGIDGALSMAWHGMASPLSPALYKITNKQ